jgi:hypothetical protein
MQSPCGKLRVAGSWLGDCIQSYGFSTVTGAVLPWRVVVGVLGAPGVLPTDNGQKGIYLVIEGTGSNAQTFSGLVPVNTIGVTLFLSDLEWVR